MSTNLLFGTQKKWIKKYSLVYEIFPRFQKSDTSLFHSQSTTFYYPVSSTINPSIRYNNESDLTRKVTAIPMRRTYGCIQRNLMFQFSVFFFNFSLLFFMIFAGKMCSKFFCGEQQQRITNIIVFEISLKYLFFFVEDIGEITGNTNVQNFLTQIIMYIFYEFFRDNLSKTPYQGAETIKKKMISF